MPFFPALTLSNDLPIVCCVTAPCLDYDLVAKSCLTLWNAMDCSPPSSSVQGILQARILEWLSFPFPEDLADPRTKHRSPALWLVSLPTEPAGKPLPALCWCKQAIGPQWNMRKYGSIIQGEFRMKTWKLGQQHQWYTWQCRKGEPRPGPTVGGGRLGFQVNIQDHGIYPVGSGYLWVGV